MKREQLEQWILLEQSGELSPKKRIQLMQELRRDPDLQNYQNTLTALSQQSRSRLPSDAGPPSDLFVRYAQRHRELKRRSPSFWTLWQPAIGYAAIAIALVMTAVYYVNDWKTAPSQLVNTQTPVSDELLDWEAPYLDDLNGLQSQFAAIETTWDADGADASTDIPDDINAIARELLKLEESS